jgi:hypothetical protein
MKMRLGWVAAVVAVVGAALGARYFWWNPVNRELTERPPRSAKQAPLPTVPSSIQISGFIPYKSLAEALTNELPQTFNHQGRQNVCVDINESVQKSVEETVGGDVGKFLGGVARVVTTVVTVNQLRNVCQDVDFTVEVRRDGPLVLSLAPSGNEVRLSVPISVQGDVGFSGDVAKALALDHKNFRGSLIAFADASIDVGANWCPKVMARSDFAWRDKAQLEVAGRFWIDIDGQSGPKIKEALQGIAEKLTSVITCEQLKAPVAAVWRVHSWPIKDAERTLAFATVVPKSVAFSGLKYESEGIRTAIGVAAITEVGTVPPLTAPDLPQVPSLERIDATSNKFSITLPLRAGYDEIQREATRVLSKSVFIGPSPAGEARVHIREATVYPSGQSVVLGLRFDAKFEKRAADMSGWVYVVGEPSLDESTQTIKLKNVRFARDVDNALWSLVSAVFRNSVKKTLEERALLDLREGIRALRVAARGSVASAAAKEKIDVAFDDSFVGLRGVSLSELSFEVAVQFDGTCNVTVADLVGLAAP